MDESAQSDKLIPEELIPLAGLLGLLMSAQALVGIGIKGLDGRYRIANPEMARLLCLEPVGLVGKAEGDILPEDACRLLAAADRRLLDGEASAVVEIDVAASHGSIMHCVWCKLPVLSAGKAVTGIASLVYDAALAPAMENLRETNRQLQLAVAELEQVASTDALTGAWNRRRLEESVTVEMDRLNRYRQPLSAMLFDIDFFKRINDYRGHDIGDEVLRSLASMLRSKMRKADSLTRWGGEEFVILCPNTTRASAALLAERLRKHIAATIFPVGGQLTVSIGVAECYPGESWEQWFKRADEALFRAKADGRNQVQLAPELDATAVTASKPEADFVRLQWHATYESGNERVDRGHRQLFANANDLLTAILSRRPRPEIDALIDQLLAEILEHFNDEERVIVASGYPDAAEHALLHRRLVDRALNCVEDYHKGKRDLGDLFQFMAYEVITKHMLGADRLFFPYLHKPSLSDGPPPASRVRKPAKRREGKNNRS